MQEHERAAEEQAQKDATREPNRAWRNRVKKQIRAQIKANEGAKGDTLLPSARTLFERRHAVLKVLSESGGAARVTYLRACTCEIGAPHTEYGRRLCLDVS